MAPFILNVIRTLNKLLLRLLSRHPAGAQPLPKILGPRNTHTNHAPKARTRGGAVRISSHVHIPSTQGRRAYTQHIRARQRMHVRRDLRANLQPVLSSATKPRQALLVEPGLFPSRTSSRALFTLLKSIPPPFSACLAGPAGSQLYKVFRRLLERLLQSSHVPPVLSIPGPGQ